MEVQDSVVVKFVSAVRDGTGLHTAVFTDPLNCAFPPMTLLTAVDVQAGAFEFDGTEGLLRLCEHWYGGRAPVPAPGADGRPHVGRAQLMEWLVALDRGPQDLLTYLLSPDSEYYQLAIDWFHKDMLPPGVESTIYAVNRTLVTVQATYLLPAAAAAAAGGGAAAPAPAAAAVAASGGGGPGSAGDAVHAKLMADSTQLG